ncbi:MAG: class II aldolase/adducin family protein, partial [Actinomycetes bacterium]|nr:class II aldolase/adducin family protein [Actinomycetes bacterium]
MSDYLRRRYEEFHDIGRDLFVSGLISSHGGNLSTREGARIFITRTGSQLGRLRETDIVAVPFTAAGVAAAGVAGAGAAGAGAVGAAGNGAATGAGSVDADADAGASVELVVHRALYQAFPQAGGVAHAHSPHSVLATLEVDELIPLDSEAKLCLPRVPVVEATKTIGSAEVAELLP